MTRDQYLMRPRPRARPITVRPRRRSRPKKWSRDHVGLETVTSLDDDDDEQQCNVNVKFKVTLHEHVRYRDILIIFKLQSVTQLDTMVKSRPTMT